MDKREANIDLIFRNGLRDYEVLPPQDVWDNIHPVVRKKTKTIIFLRIAAVFSAFISIGIITYFLTRTAVSPGELASLDIKGGLPLREEVVPGSPGRQLAVITDIQMQSQPVVAAEPESEFEKAPAFEQEELTGPEVRNDDQENDRVASVPVTLSKVIIPDDQVPGFATDVKAPQADRWSIAAMASPTFYSSMGAKNPDKPAVSYSGGFNVAYKINKRLTIQTGVYYASNGQKVDGIASFAGFGKYNQTKGYSNFEVTTASGPVAASNPDMFLLDVGPGKRVMTAYTSDFFDPEKSNLSYLNSNIIQSFSYLEMPVMIRYKIIDKSLDINIIGGVSYDFLLGNSVFTRSGGQKVEIGKTKGMNNLAFSSSLGMGMEYSLSGKISLNLEPTFRYFLNPVNDLANPGIHTYSFGVFSGFSYRF